MNYQFASLTHASLMSFDNPLRLKTLFAHGASKPGWCFAAWDGDTPIGQVGFKGNVRDPRLVHLFGLSGRAGATEPLLTHALAVMRSEEVKVVFAEVRGNSGDADILRDWLIRSGFTLLETRTVYRWLDPWPMVPVPDTLTFRSMEDLGEDVFFAAFSRAAKAPIDRADFRAVQVLGEEDFADYTFDFLKEQNYHSHWWYAAYKEDQLVGCVCPYLYLPKMGTPGFSGVLPGLRGLGYEATLLAKATAVLQSRGVDELFLESALPVMGVGGFRAGERVLIYQYNFS